MSDSRLIETGTGISQILSYVAFFPLTPLFPRLTLMRAVNCRTLRLDANSAKNPFGVCGSSKCMSAWSARLQLVTEQWDTKISQQWKRCKIGIIYIVSNVDTFAPNYLFTDRCHEMQRSDGKTAKTMHVCNIPALPSEAWLSLFRERHSPL